MKLISTSVTLLCTFCLCFFGCSSSHSDYVVQSVGDPSDQYILVHTLRGDLILVERLSGKVQWAQRLDPVLRTTYDGGPVLIADPVDGRLYEYSDEVSADILRHLDHSIMGYIRRSPAYYKEFLSFGSKVDFWMYVDLKTGQLFQSASQDLILQCPGQLNSPPNVRNNGNEHKPVDLIGVGRTQYNLLFRDPLTGLTRLNITYTVLAIHTELDVQNLSLRHIALTQPGLLTFDDSKLLWYLPLSSPVVGLYSLWSPPQFSVAVGSCDHTSKPSVLPAPPMEQVKKNKSSETNQTTNFSGSSEFSNPTTFSTSTPLVPRILRGISFPTYALDVPQDLASPATSSAIIELLKFKFNGSLELAPSLLVGSSVSAPLYAITCVAEASLKLRGIRRAPESFMIEGPIYLPAHLPKDPVNWSGIPTGLTGLYELPTGKSKTWPWNYQPPDPQLPQLGGPEIDALRHNCPGLTAIGSNTTERGRWHLVYLPLIAVTTLVCLFFTVYVLRRRRVFQFPRLISDSVDLSFLPTHFDTPDSTGWAGCTAQEAGQPEAIRINLNEVLGHGANGTMVFAGMFGTHQTAVKRIVRQPQLEKHWRREHAILLRHHHPHLVRCYWTGSTANFHYLVMQRCETTLSELLRTASPLHSFQMWGLTPCEVIHQVLQAVVCLHQNHIVHRDLKPSNVLIATGDFGGQARAVVGDFGLSRPMPAGRTDLTNSLGSHLTDTMWGTKTNSSNNGNPNPPGSNVIYHNNDVRSAGAVAAAAISPLDPGSDLTSVGVTFGTLGWMAPELCDPETKHLTYSIDIFACGLLAYHVLTGGEHPYDQSELSDSEQPSVKMDSGSSGTSNRPGAVDSGINGINRHFPAISESNHSPTPVCHSIASRLSRHHARQLAIAENRTPSLNRLTESKCLVDLPRAFLGRQLIQTMLSHDPVDRPSAEEVIYDPLFWTASKTIRFLSELSDVLDTRDEEIQSTGSSPTNSFSSRQNNVNPRPTTHRFFAERRALLETLNPHAPFVFSEHWFHRLEPELVLDLLNTRGYDDTSLMDLLRAIRNKHNHFWHLPEHVRSLFGGSQDGMAVYWTTRFPSLVPLLYALCRHHLSGFSGLSEFLPTLRSEKSQTAFVPSDWWYTTGPVFLQLGLSKIRELLGSLQYANPKSPSCNSQSYSPIISRRAEALKPWKRGEVVASSATINSASPSRVASNHPVRLEWETVSGSDLAPLSPPVEPAGLTVLDLSVAPDSVEHTGRRPRRRPNQAKKIRPRKKDKKAARERQEIVARAGCELSTAVKTKIISSSDS